MKQETRDKLERVFSYPFFQRIGGKLPESVVSIPSWPVAIEECNKPKWERCRLMARNTLQRLIEQRDWARIEDWEPLGDELLPAVTEFVERSLTRMSLDLETVSKLQHHVSWDIMFICMEFEFRDVVEPMFHLPLLDPWYEKGHFPCGWTGEAFPDRWDGRIGDGKLSVY
jgi:hypothetical protein